MNYHKLAGVGCFFKRGKIFAILINREEVLEVLQAIHRETRAQKTLLLRH